MDEWKEPNYLVHHGIKGQRWGVRRFQNLDGSLTAAGRRRYGDSSETTTVFTDGSKYTTTRTNRGLFNDVVRTTTSSPNSQAWRAVNGNNGGSGGSSLVRSVDLTLENAADKEEDRLKKLERDQKELQTIQDLTATVKKAMAASQSKIIDSALSSVLSFLNKRQVSVSQQIYVDQQLLSGTQNYIHEQRAWRTDRSAEQHQRRQ